MTGRSNGGGAPSTAVGAEGGGGTHIARIFADDQPRNPAGGSTVEATETFPSVTLWEKFDEACKEAEPIRDLLIEEAKRERDLVVKSNPWRVHSRERINAMAEDRCDRKVKAAEAMSRCWSRRPAGRDCAGP
jgi:hypothetical protein